MTNEKGDILYNLTWSKKELTRQKLGIFGEYYAKMFLISYGIDLYSTVVDDHGVDFVAETKKGFFKIQVKTIRGGTNYIYMGEKYFNISEKNLYLLIVLLKDNEEPVLYLLPSSVWTIENQKVFVHYSYKGKKSKPEYGVNLSKKNLPVLEKYKIENTIQEWLE